MAGTFIGIAEKARCEGLELEMMETRGQLEVAVMEISSLQQKSNELEEECLERNKMAKEWYDALQVSNFPLECGTLG